MPDAVKLKLSYATNLALERSLLGVDTKAFRLRENFERRRRMVSYVR